MIWKWKVEQFYLRCVINPNLPPNTIFESVKVKGVNEWEESEMKESRGLADVSSICKGYVFTSWAVAII